MKIHILFPFVTGPYGGANQFLKALRTQFKRQGFYTDSPQEAQAILVNGNPSNIGQALTILPQLARRATPPVIALRLDGPISLSRGQDRLLDVALKYFSRAWADGLVFQSHWSQQQNQKLFNIQHASQTIIYNAPDPHYFYPAAAPPPTTKIRLIATSWSNNTRKGFALYQYLDQHLDFNRYSVTFVGDSPITFKNITHIAPVPSAALGQLLREHHIYITASQHDACSNALIEALASGLPAVALKSGGHPELTQNGGIMFTSQSDLLGAIEQAREHYHTLQRRLPTYAITHIAQQYLDFIAGLHPKTRRPLSPMTTPGIKALFYVNQLTRL